jgi:hypothetical protein
MNEQVARREFLEAAIIAGVSLPLSTLLQGTTAHPRILMEQVVCNLADKKWEDEFALVADWTHRCFLIASSATAPKRGKAVGPLDPGQMTTLKAVIEFGPVTGAGLERQWQSEAIKATAWNNRLRDLYDKRLVRRERRGREQMYSTVLKEIELDG